MVSQAKIVQKKTSALERPTNRIGVQVKIPVPAPLAVRPKRIAGLDFLRAIAVLLVIAYHFFPQVVPGGFVGVDVFFVISGFLITSLLLREHRVFQRINLKQFWLRRARRLLPALGLAVLVSTALAVLVGSDAQVGLRSQIMGAATFSTNWVFVAQGADYGANLSPALFSNLWSLAVEEQFYLLWPLVVVAGLALSTREIATRRWGWLPLIIVTALIAAGSAVAMTLGYQAGLNPSRLYFGTDTHLFGIMLGALLAMVRTPNRSGHWPKLARGNGVVAALLAAVSLGAIIVAGFTLDFDSAEPFRGGLVLVSFATAGLIAAILSAQDAAAKLEVAPIAWVGRRSYGLYLWHWPILVISAYAFQSRDVGTNVDPLTAIIAVTATFAAAWASYRFVEEPIIKHGFREFWSRVRAGIRAKARSGVPGRLILVSGGILSIMTAALVVFAVLSAPQESSIEHNIAAGQAALVPDPPPTDVASPAPTPTPAPTAAPQPTAVPEPVPETTPDPMPEPPAETVAPEPVTGQQVTVIGDSVTLASVPGLQQALPGVAIDAETSRNISKVPAIVAKLAQEDKLRQYVVISVGTNAVVTAQSIDKIAAITKDRPLIFVTAHGERKWIKDGNKFLLAEATKRDNVFVADWNAVIAEHPDELARDGVHPGQAGGERYAKEIVRALAQASEAKANEQ